MSNPDAENKPKPNPLPSPSEDVIDVAGSIAQRMFEGPGNTLQLKDMTPEQLARQFSADNIHNGSHFMSPADNSAYQELCRTDMKTAVKFLRDKWAEYADHDFMNDFKLVHWVGDSAEGLADLEKLAGPSQSHEVEISTQGYRDQASLDDSPRWLQAKFGVLIDGQVTLASNQDMQTNQWHGPHQDDPTKRLKYTEWANRLMTNQDDCVSPYEFVVGDWKPAGIIVDPDTPDLEAVTALAQQLDLQVVDSHSNSLFEDPATSS